MMNDPEDLKNKLIVLFPSFEEEMKKDDEIDYGYEETLTYHHIWITFAPMAHEYLIESTNKIQKAFCDIINNMVSEGGVKENAVSTCLLEHATQINIKKMIKPYLSSEAKNELR